MMELIREQPFFKDIDESFLQLFEGCASNQHFKEGQYLLREGEESTHFFIIRKGKVAIEIYAGNKGAIKIQTLDPSDPLGWSWLFPPFRNQFDALALRDTTVLAFAGDCLRKKIRSDSKFGYEMLLRLTNAIVERLGNTRLQLIDIYK